jgi:hypothetical protein
MEGQRLVTMEHEALLGERDAMPPEERERTFAANALDPRRDRRGIDALRLRALEPQQHRLVAAVPLAGGAERAVELRADRGDAIEQTL